MEDSCLTCFHAAHQLLCRALPQWDPASPTVQLWTQLLKFVTSRLTSDLHPVSLSQSAGCRWWFDVIRTLPNTGLAWITTVSCSDMKICYWLLFALQIILTNFYLCVKNRLPLSKVQTAHKPPSPYVQGWLLLQYMSFHICRHSSICLASCNNSNNN